MNGLGREGTRLEGKLLRRLFSWLLFSAALLPALHATPAFSQAVYHNLVNRPFRTIGNGPQSAIIVDVNDPKNADEVFNAVRKSYSGRFKFEANALRQEISFLQDHHLLKPGQEFGIVDAAIIRNNGRMIPPIPADRTRSGNDISFTIPTGDGTNSTWSNAEAADLQNLVSLLYPELKSVLGAPGWNTGGAPVQILNYDPRLNFADSILGALVVVNGNSLQIWFPKFQTYETRFMAMAQAMAQCFHGPYRIGYDAWEQGMARAAAVVAAQDLKASAASGTGQTVGQQVDPSTSFYYTSSYDLLNQPALGNSTFTPPTLSSQPFKPDTLSGMLLPRMQMSSTAWLKCYIEDSQFFQRFNASLYTSAAGNLSILNNVNSLRGIAGGVLPNVEALVFDDWFERQYVLDTSNSPGNKLYVYSQPTFPTSPTANDGGAAVFLSYYQTTSAGDEIAITGTSNIVYRDNSSQILSLPSFDIVAVTKGFGAVSPIFSGIGANPKMRLSMDFPIGKEYSRIYFPANEAGLESAPTSFSGVVVGADLGSLVVTFDGGSGAINTTFAQGAFGLTATASVPNGFSRAHFTLTPASSAPLLFQRNVFVRGENVDPNQPFSVSPIFVLNAPDSVLTLSHTFPLGPQMMSLPLRPLIPDFAKALGIDVSSALLAQYRQDLTTDDKYTRYPSLGPYQPGYALWGYFNRATAVAVKGIRTDSQSDISIAAEFGWNQIANPYNVNLNITTQVTIITPGGDILPLADAVTQGFVAAGVIAYSQTSNSYVDLSNPAADSDTSVPLNTLEPWKGYWIRIISTEGVTITFSNPNSRAATQASKAAKNRTKSASQSDREGWTIPMQLKGSAGAVSSAVLGQSSRGSENYVAALDAANPPAFSTTKQLAVTFAHPEWDSGKSVGSGQYLSDIRHTGARSEWNLEVTTPDAAQSYTLNWVGTAHLPRGMRLVLTDQVTGRKYQMNRESGISFIPTKGQSTRSFQILAEPHSIGRLTIRNVVAIQPMGVRGRAPASVSIAFELSEAADTLVEIRLGGRIVRRIAQGRAASIGLNQMVWDMRDDKGRTLAAGAYTLQITARGNNGDQTRMVVPMLVSR